MTKRGAYYGTVNQNSAVLKSGLYCYSVAANMLRLTIRPRICAALSTVPFVNAGRKQTGYCNIWAHNGHNTRKVSRVDLSSVRCRIMPFGNLPLRPKYSDANCFFRVVWEAQIGPVQNYLCSFFNVMNRNRARIP